MKRIDRYKAFEKFFENSKSAFREIADADPRNRYFEATYSLCITPGGWDGGQNKRVVEVFYGQRPFDVVKKRRKSANTPFPEFYKTFATEHGAMLRYQQTDSGTVICELRPAGTEEWRAQEDSIILEWISNPNSLNNRFTLRRHWRAFLSYMQCTSIDGEPTFVDQFVVWRMRWIKRRVINQRDVGIKILSSARDVIKWVMTVGFGGILVLWVDRCVPKHELKPTNSSMTNIVRIEKQDGDGSRKDLSPPVSRVDRAPHTQNIVSKKRFKSVAPNSTSTSPSASSGIAPSPPSHITMK